MSIITKQLGRVSIVPKGAWSSNNIYLRLDLVNYQGKLYIAKQDVPINIDIENTEYWVLVTEKGDKGNTGTFITSITKTNTSQDGLTDTYTITFSDTLPPYTFTVTNGTGVVSVIDGILAIGQEVTLLITGNGAPSISTSAPVLTRYFDILNNVLYICIAHNINGSEITYVWIPIGIASNIVGVNYDNTLTYAIGDCILKIESNNSQQLYRCTTAITTPEAWNPLHWEAVDINTELSKKYEKLEAGILKADLASTTQAYLNKADTVIQPNFIDNWYFIGGGSQQGGEQFPINRRGKEQYSSSRYTIDRWKIYSYTNLIVDSNGIIIQRTSNALSLASVIRQQLPTTLTGAEEMTLTVLVTEVIGSFAVAYGSSTDTSKRILTERISSPGLYTVTGVPGVSSDPMVGIFSRSSGEALYKIKAIKLEHGNAQTLAHLENGVWVLNELPNYQEQLIRCKTSTADLEDEYANQPIVYTSDYDTIISKKCPDVFEDIWVPSWHVTRIKEGSFIASTRLYLSQIPIDGVTTSGIGYTGIRYIRFPYPSFSQACVSGVTSTIDGIYLGQIQNGDGRYPVGIKYRLFNPNKSSGTFTTYCRFITTGLMAKPLERPEFTNENSTGVKQATAIAETYINPQKDNVEYRFTYGPSFVGPTNPVLTGNSVKANVTDPATGELLYGGRLVCNSFVTLILAGIPFKDSPFMDHSNTYGTFTFDDLMPYVNPENYNWCRYLFTSGRMIENPYRGSVGYVSVVSGIAMLMWQLWTSDSDTTPVTIFSNKNDVQEGDIGFIQNGDLEDDSGGVGFDNIRHIVYIGADKGELYVYEVTWEKKDHLTAVYKTKFSEYNRDITYFARLRYDSLS